MNERKSEKFFNWLRSSKIHGSVLLPWQVTFAREYLDGDDGDRELVFSNMPMACGRTYIMELIGKFEKQT